jgi:glucose-1-phosphate adenylyltransferase
MHGSNSISKNSLISEGCKIYGTVENSILSGGVIVEEGAVVRDSVIMEDVIIKAGAKVFTSIVDSDVVIDKDAVVGCENAGKDKITVIAKGTKIAPKAIVCD